MDRQGAAPKIAIVHDWLVEFGGAEQVLKALIGLWPQAPIYTLIHDPKGQCAELAANHDLRTSFLQKWPGARRRHRLLLPFMPLAVEQFDLSEYDVVLSSSYAVARGVITRPDQLHAAYVHTPIRYAWELQHQYLQQSRLDRRPAGLLARPILHYLRLWDQASANRVDAFAANSFHTAQRVWKTYRREAQVIYPPVDTLALQPKGEKEDFYLTVSRLVPYKRIDLILEAFERLPERRLVVIGDGPDRKKLQARAGSNVTFLGYQPFEVLRDHLQRARAFVFAALEDFGIAPVEAQACGTPVIAYQRGGAREVVIEGETGLFFDEQSADSLYAAIRQFEQRQTDFDLAAIRRNAERFGLERFQWEMRRFVEGAWEQLQERWQMRPPRS